MMINLRTTVNIDDSLFAEAKVLAAQNNLTLGEIIGDALRAELHRRRDAQTLGRVVLATDGGSGLRPGVNLEDKDSLAVLLGDDA